MFNFFIQNTIYLLYVEEEHRSYEIPGEVIILLIFMVIMTIVILHLKDKS